MSKTTGKWRGPAKLHFQFSLRRRPPPRQRVETTKREIFSQKSVR